MAMATSTAIALALAAAAAGTSAYNTNQTNKRTDEAAAAGLREQSAKQRKADTVVDDLIKKTGASDASDEKSGAMQNYMRQLSANKGVATGGLGVAGGGGAAYQKDAADAALGVSDYGTKIADMLSSIDAPRYQRLDEANMRGDAATDIGVIKRESAGQDFLNKLRLQGIRRNPWLDAAATAMSSYAGSSMGGTGAGASGGSAPGWWDASGSTGWGGV